MLYERNKTKHDNFAYINVPLKDFRPMEQVSSVADWGNIWEYELLAHDLPVIGYNQVIAKFQMVIHFRIINNRQQATTMTGEVAGEAEAYAAGREE